MRIEQLFSHCIVLTACLFLHEAARFMTYKEECDVLSGDDDEIGDTRSHPMKINLKDYHLTLILSQDIYTMS